MDYVDGFKWMVLDIVTKAHHSGYPEVAAPDKIPTFTFASHSMLMTTL